MVGQVRDAVPTDWAVEVGAVGGDEAVVLFDGESGSRERSRITASSAACRLRRAWRMLVEPEGKEVFGVPLPLQGRYIFVVWGNSE